MRVFLFFFVASDLFFCCLLSILAVVSLALVPVTQEPLLPTMRFPLIVNLKAMDVFVLFVLACHLLATPSSMIRINEPAIMRTVKIDQNCDTVVLETRKKE